MQKLVKYLAIFSVFLSSVAIINGIICAIFMVIHYFMPYEYYLYDVSERVYIFEIIVTVAAITFILLLQSLWILLQVSKK